MKGRHRRGKERVYFSRLMGWKSGGGMEREKVLKNPIFILQWWLPDR